MMGLDILQDTGISSQLNSVMETVEGLGEGEKLVVFFCLWVVAKSVCLDALALVREKGSEGGREGGREGSFVLNLGPVLISPPAPSLPPSLPPPLPSFGRPSGHS